MSIIIPIEKITIPFRNAYRNEDGTQHYDLMPNEHMNIVEKENNIKINRVIHRGADTTYRDCLS